MKPFHALSSDDLLKILQKELSPVPPRGKGRTKKHTESWVTCHFLAGIAGSDLLEYPLCIEPGDRHDLVLSYRSGKTGIEITEGVHKDDAKVDAYSEHKGISGARLFPQYRIEDEHSRKEIEDIARGRHQPQKFPHIEDRVQQNWIGAIMHFAKRKAEKFALLEFDEYDRNWLLIYDNWSPAVHGYHNVATPLARQLFDSEWQNPFEKVFILANPYTLENHYVVWEFSRNAEIMKHHVPDWSSYSAQLAS